MRGGIGFGSQPKGGSGVATGTARYHRDIAVKTRWQPTCKARFVAGHTGGCGRYVVGGLAGGSLTVVATRAVGGNRERAVVCLGT